MRRTLFVFASLIALTSCKEAGNHTWKTRVADVTCGSMKLRFEERGHSIGFPAGVTSFTPVLLMDDGHGLTVVDASGANISPAAYSRLLPASVRFHSFHTDKRSSTPPWIVYADPAAVSERQYDAIASCIDANLGTIDAAWDAPREPKDASSVRRFRITAMLRAAYDPRFNYSDRVALGMMWECPGGAFLKTAPPDMVMFCRAGDVCGIAGRILSDQKSLMLYASKGLPPSLQREAGSDAQSFYGRCHDASGASLYTTLQPKPWNDEEWSRN